MPILPNFKSLNQEQMELNLEQLELSKEKKIELNNNNSSEFLASYQNLDDSVRLYLKAIGQIPQLSPKEELETAKKINTSNESESKAAVNLLVKSNLRLVVSIAKRFSGTANSCSLLDLIQEGNTGLMKAAQRFHYKLGYRFSTYASWWVKQSIKKALNHKLRAIKIPPHALEQINDLKRVIDCLEKKYGRAPTDQELAKFIQKGLSPSEINLWREHFVQGTISLDSPVKQKTGENSSLESEESGMTSLLSDLPEKLPEFRAQQKILREQLNKLILSLDSTEKQVLSLRFGLNPEQKTYTLEEVAEITKLNKPKVKSLEARALRNLRIKLGKTEKDFNDLRESIENN